ncbi:hypothetical protein ZOSMA_45G00250 [Zostera marina]|uniref:cAMP-regulated phosphoprotein 19-related protein n=1 Tax=Zostera marina TaxID=29655 RepID=A0A0K9P094_ZOSMR|nr:hypothetical protein ZOSMA_45G00250 [Zostera marina]
MSDVTQQPAVIETVDKVEAQANIDVPSDPEPIQEENKEDPKETFQQEEEALKKKYGGILPKKMPLLSKDHERAFFDSADWALGKQGGVPMGKPKGPLEALRPKLQPTPQQPSRRSAYSQQVDGEEP